MKRSRRAMVERGVLGPLKCWRMEIMGVSVLAAVEGEPMRASRWMLVSWRSVGAAELRRPWYSLDIY